MIRIFRHYISTAYLWLLMAESLVFYLAMYCGAGLRFLYTASWYSQSELGASAAVFSTVFIACCSGLGLYRKTLDKEEYNILQRISFSFAVAVFILAFIYYIIPDLMLARSVLISAIIFSFVGLLLTRYLFYRFVNLDNLKRRVLVVGCGQRAGELSVVNSSYIYRGFEIVGYITLEDEPISVPHAIALNEKIRLTDIVEAANVDEIVIAVDDRRKKLPVEELLDIKMSGVQIMDLQTFYEREQRLVFLEALSPSWLMFSKAQLRYCSQPVAAFRKLVADDSHHVGNLYRKRFRCPGFLSAKAGWLPRHTLRCHQVSQYAYRCRKKWRAMG